MARIAGADTAAVLLVAIAGSDVDALGSPGTSASRSRLAGEPAAALFSISSHAAFSVF
jgi:hypothetical protein